jgi:hypothetical protein
MTRYVLCAARDFLTVEELLKIESSSGDTILVPEKLGKGTGYNDTLGWNGDS